MILVYYASGIVLTLLIWWMLEGLPMPSLPAKKQLKMLDSERSQLSVRAQEVYDKYMSLPLESRTMNIVPALKVIDIECGGKDAIADHYTKGRALDANGSLMRYWSAHHAHVTWSALHYKLAKDCPEPKFKDIAAQVDDVIKAHAEQQKAVALCAAGGTTEVELMASHLRQEADIIRQVTTEISK